MYAETPCTVLANPKNKRSCDFWCPICPCMLMHVAIVCVDGVRTHVLVLAASVYAQICNCIYTYTCVRAHAQVLVRVLFVKFAFYLMLFTLVIAAFCSPKPTRYMP